MDLGTDLAVIVSMAHTIFGTFHTGNGAGFCQLRAVVGIARRELGMQRRDVYDIGTKPITLIYPLVAEILGGSPLTDCSGFVANRDSRTDRKTRQSGVNPTNGDDRCRRCHGISVDAETLRGPSIQNGHKSHTTRTRNNCRMEASTLVIVFGGFLFVLPIPGTFIAGTLVVLAGVIARSFGA